MAAGVPPHRGVVRSLESVMNAPPKIQKIAFIGDHLVQRLHLVVLSLVDMLDAQIARTYRNHL